LARLQPSAAGEIKENNFLKGVFNSCGISLINFATLKKMEPLLDKLSRLKAIKGIFATIRICDKGSDRFARFVLTAFELIRNVIAMRLALICGACLCFVIGGYWIAEDIVYNVGVDDFLGVINGLAFLPLIAMAPRYKNGKIIYALIGFLEGFVIFMGLEIQLR
jgi:hypothetical protein